MDTFFKDLRYGIRNLLKQPLFAIVAVCTLVLAIGGNSAMFTVVNAVLLRPLPYPESNRIVAFEGVNPSKGLTQSNMSIPDFADWQNQNQVFEQMAVYSGLEVRVTFTLLPPGEGLGMRVWAIAKSPHPSPRGKRAEERSS